MRLSKFVIAVLIGVLSTNMSAQDYFVVQNDTTFCKNLDYRTTAQGYLKKISYINSEGNEVSIEGRKNVPDVITFYRDSLTIDKIPLKASKPDSYVRYIARAVDGKLKTYSNAFTRSKSADKYTPGNPLGDWNYGGTMGAYHYTIKMPNGIFYDISNKNIKKHIKPFLLKCVEFKNQYKGEYKKNEVYFNQMIELYNSLCD
uniref:hypothetical protein n=1 Tax=Gelidibacter sp. TaxID=2018083 RepID=UPI00404A98B5